MRKYSPPPDFKRHDYCECDEGTLYVSHQYFLPLYVCSTCGFAGHEPNVRTIDANMEDYPEREAHLTLIERMYAWIGVRAPKAQRVSGQANEYLQVMKDSASVLRNCRMEKEREDE